MNAQEIIATLGMQPHPEGGWYVEMFRDTNGGERGHSSAIYFLLQKGERSHWHRVRDAVEIWHFYAGAPLLLHQWGDGAHMIKTVRLGIDLSKDERPQGVVPSNVWQSAESTGNWTLVGCTVAPGFLFSAFELATPDWEPPVRR